MAAVLNVTQCLVVSHCLAINARSTESDTSLMVKCMKSKHKIVSLEHSVAKLYKSIPFHVTVLMTCGFYQVPSLQDLFKTVKPEVILEFLKAAALYRLL